LTSAGERPHNVREQKGEARIFVSSFPFLVSGFRNFIPGFPFFVPGLQNLVSRFPFLFSGFRNLVLGVPFLASGLGNWLGEAVSSLVGNKNSKNHGAQVLEAYFTRSTPELQPGKKVGLTGFAPVTTSAKGNVSFRCWGTPCWF